MFNLEGFKPGDLRVTGPVLAEMFMGKIGKWNDPKLVALNPGKTFAGPGHHRGAPRRRFGHDVQLDRLSQRRQQGMGGYRGQGRRGQVAGSEFGGR